MECTSRHSSKYFLLLNDTFGNSQSCMPPRQLYMGQQLISGLHQSRMSYFPIGTHEPNMPVILQKNIQVNSIRILSGNSFLTRCHRSFGGIRS